MVKLQSQDQVAEVFLLQQRAKAVLSSEYKLILIFHTGSMSTSMIPQFPFSCQLRQVGKYLIKVPDKM